VADGGPIDHSYINDIYTLFYSLNNSMIPSGLFLNNTMISSGLFFGLTIIDEPENSQLPNIKLLESG
jgi:hypothetical protein